MTTAAQRMGLERNLRLVSLHALASGALFWLPTMVLYTRSVFGLGRAVMLSGIYYLFVVALEVPSGWASDRFGRVPTLRAAALSWIVAHGLFLVAGDSFVAFAAGQAFLAGGFAALSGTDVSFHYDSLESVDRAGEYQARQGRVASLGYRSMAAAALIGGGLGFVDLRLPYAAALILALIQFGVTMAMTEPVVDGALDPVHALAGQIGDCVRYLARPLLGWIFFYGVAMVVLEHVAFTLLQPWLTEASGATAQAVESTPVLSGVVMAAVAAVGAVAARAVDPLARRFGIPLVLVALGVLSAGIVTTMALSFSLLVLAAVAFRSVQGAAAPVLISAAVAPRVRPNQRATFLSLNSLAGRLVWGSILLGVGGMIDEDLRLGLGVLSAIAWGFVAALIASLVLVVPRIPTSEHGFARSGSMARNSSGGESAGPGTGES